MNCSAMKESNLWRIMQTMKLIGWTQMRDLHGTCMKQCTKDWHDLMTFSWIHVFNCQCFSFCPAQPMDNHLKWLMRSIAQSSVLQVEGLRRYIYIWFMMYIDLDDWQASTGMIMFGQRRTCICKLRSIMGMETSQVQQGTWKRRAQVTSSLCRVFCAALMVDSPFFPSSRWKKHWRSRCSPNSYRMAKHSVAIVAPGPAGLLIHVGAIVLKDWGWAA